MVTPVHVRARQRGFTFAELLAVVAIVAILAGVAAPAMGGLVAGQRARAATSDVYTALVQARSEAIKRNAEVTLLPTTSGHWEAGWSIPNPSDSGHPVANHPGVKGGTIVGETDELGFHITKDKVHVHDLHATLLHLLGFDHTKLTYRFQGRDFRLTDVEGEIVQGLLA